MKSILTITLIKTGVWLIVCTIITTGVHLYTANREWTGATYVVVYVTTWLIIAITYPWFKQLVDYFKANEPGVGFPTAVGLYLVAFSALNPLLPMVGIPTFPLLSWLPLPSFEVWVLCLVFLPPAILIGIVIYTVISAITDAVRTGTFW